MKVKSYKLRVTGSSGFSTLEIMIAFMIMTLTLTAITLVTASNQTTSISSQTSNEALAKAQGQLEEMRALSHQDLSLVQNCDDSSATKCSGSLDAYYNRKVTVTDIDSFSKKVISEVTWTEGGRPLIIALSTIVADWNSALGGDTCSPTLSGDWTNPQLLGSADVGANNGGTDVDVIGKRAYITADPSAGSGKPNFYVIDITNPNLDPLPILGNVDTNPSFDTGLAAIHVAGKYAYVAHMSTVSQLQIIDVSNSALPALAKNLPDLTSTSDSAVGNSVFYSSKRIYLGLTKSTGAEFYVIDVTDPLNPTVKASFEINSGVNAIVVKNGIAYLAVPDDPSTAGIAEQMKVLDVSQADSGTITALNPFGPNYSTMSGKGLYLSKDGDTIYLGEAGLNPSNKPQFFSLNVTDPNNISIINSKYIPSGSGDESVNAISVRNNLAFMWTSVTNLGFQIWDLNNLSNSTPYGSLNTSQTATGGLDCDGNYLFTAQKSQKAFQIIGPTVASVYTLSNNGNITAVQGLSGSNTIVRTLVSGNPPAENLSVMGLPAGATAAFTNNPCAPNCSSILTVTTTFPTTPVGTYPVTVKNNSGTVTTSFNLIVTTQPFDYTLSNSGNITVIQGSSGNNNITKTLVSGTTQAVTLSTSGLPAGATATFNNTCSPTCTTQLTISTLVTTPAGTYPITVNGTGGKTTTFNLVVNPQPFDYSLSVAPTPITMSQGTTRTLTVTVTKTAGTAQLVTMTFSSNLQNNVTITPTPAPNSCTPSAGSCNVDFTITAASNAQKLTRTITVTGSSPAHTTTFVLTITN